MAGARTLKLLQYQHTKDLLEGINQEEGFQKISLPLAAGAENQPTIQQSEFSSSFALRRLRHDFELRNRALMRSHLETLIDVLNENNKQGIIDPLKYEYSQLLNRINLGEPVSLNEFEDAIKKFSLNHTNMTALQDEINNKKVDLEINPEETEEATQTPDIVDFPQPDLQEDNLTAQQSGSQEESSSNQPTQRVRSEPPRRVIIQKPEKPQYGMTKEEYAKYKEEHKEERDARARELWAQRKAEREGGEEEKKKRLGKPGQNQALGKNPLSSRLNNWIKNKFANTRLGKSLQNLNSRLANTNLGRGLTRINNLLNAPSRFLSRLGSNLGRLAGNTLRNLGSQALRGASQIISQAARFLANSAARALSGFSSQAAGGAARTAAGTIGRGALLILGNPITWMIIGIAALFIFVWWYDNMVGNSECGKPAGLMKVEKSMGGLNVTKEGVGNGEQIDYVIKVTYELACRTRFLPSVVVTDKLPEGTDYVEGSAKSGFYNTPGTAPDGVYDEETRTVTWTFQNFPMANNTAYLELSVLPKTDDFWAINEAKVKYVLDTQAPGTAGTIVAATQDNCSGTYQLTNPVGNFGDPGCDFNKNDLYTLLKQNDSSNADFWFYQVVRCESGYNPNSWRDPNIWPFTPDSAGAWGLYQMGRGKNGQYDHGDVQWQQQTTNAVNYSKQIPSIAAYWACARLGET